MRKRLFIGILATLTLTLTLAMMPTYCSAQVMDNSHRIDTLSIWQRISIRTNMPDWVLGVPNIGGEFDIRKENWNRWSAGFNIRWRPASIQNMVKPFRYQLFEATLEGREYWRERKATPYGYLSPHRHWWQKLFSCRNASPSHPNWIFYRGGYVTYSQYSMMFGGEGRQGTAYMAGFTWGIVKPFLAWGNGLSLDMEFGFSAGAMLNEYDTYTNDDERNVYAKTGHKDMHLAPMIREIHAGLVLRMGNYPIQKKYRWRYDVDMPFREKTDARYDAWLTQQEHKFYADSVYKEVYSDFRVLYDSCVAIRHVEAQEKIDAKAPKRVGTADDATVRQTRQPQVKKAGKSETEGREARAQQRLERRKAKLEEKYARKEEKMKAKLGL